MDKTPCPACVAWTCSTCGHRRNSINSMWANPHCARCRGTIGVRHPIVHRNKTLRVSHMRDVAGREPGETVREDGLVFRWPAPPLAEPVEPRHPDGTNADAVLMGRPFAVWSQILTSQVSKNLEDGTATWSELLLSRVFNALSMEDPGRIMQNLDRVSELVTEWYTDLERRTG